MGAWWGWSEGGDHDPEAGLAGAHKQASNLSEVWSFNDSKEGEILINGMRELLWLEQ